MKNGGGGREWNKQHSDSIKSLMRALVSKLFTVYSMCSTVLELLMLNVLFVIYKHFSLFYFQISFLQYNLITDAVYSQEL